MEHLRRDQDKAIVFHWRTIGGIQAISPANAVFGCIFSYSPKVHHSSIMNRIGARERHETPNSCAITYNWPYNSII